MEQHLFSFACCLIFAIASSMGKHIHSHHSSKERLEDGAYSPRQKMIIMDEREKFDHEAILGSLKEAAEFDQLSDEEAKRRLSVLLTIMDVNGDGFIEPQELFMWIVKSLKKLSTEEADDFFDDADQDNNGEVTWEEQILDTLGDDTDTDNLDTDDDFILAPERRLFTLADLDNNGVLNRAEYARFMHPEDFPDMFPAIIENTLFEKDLNKDGVIDYSEFVNGSKLDQQSLIAEKTKFEVEYDKNHDGKLSHEEILTWVVPNNTQIAVEETKHLFASADDDHDAKLSFGEILLNHHIFVGSEATDFGEQLDNIHDIIVMNDEL